MADFGSLTAIIEMLKSKGFHVDTSQAYVEGVQGSATACFGDVCTSNARVVYLQRSNGHRCSTACAGRAALLRLGRRYGSLSSILARIISQASPRVVLLCGSNDEVNAALLQVLWALDASGLTPSCVVALEDTACRLAEGLGWPVVELQHVKLSARLVIAHAVRKGVTEKVCVYVYPSWRIEKLRPERLELETCSEIIITVVEGYPSLRGISCFLASRLGSRPLFVAHGETVGLYRPDRLLIVWGVKNAATGRRWGLIAVSSAIMAAKFHRDPRLRSSLYRAVRCADKWLREGNIACSGLLPRLLYGSWLAIGKQGEEVRLVPLPTALYLLRKGDYILYNIDSSIAISSREALATILDVATREAMNLGCC